MPVSHEDIDRRLAKGEDRLAAIELVLQEIRCLTNQGNTHDRE